MEEVIYFFLLFLLPGLLFSLECTPVGLSPKALPSKPCSLCSAAPVLLLNPRACLSPYELNHWVQFMKPSCLPQYLLSVSISYFGFITNYSFSVFCNIHVHFWTRPFHAFVYFLPTLHLANSHSSPFKPSSLTIPPKISSGKGSAGLVRPHSILLISAEALSLLNSSNPVESICFHD